MEHMLNLLWCMMMLIGIVYGAFNGTIPEITDAALSSAREAVTLCISIAGVIAFWNGMMKIAEETGLVRAAARYMQPLLVWLMPGIRGEEKIIDAISTNLIANVLGLGWAATPAGLRAMEELGRLEERRRNGADRGGKDSLLKNKAFGKKGRTRGMPKGVASNEMCTFLIINISSLQLIPVNVIAYRSQYGSVNPTAVVGPGLLATAVSTGAAVVFCKVMDSRRRRV